jgi:transglutaminase-like putative cysteine protease
VIPVGAYAHRFLFALPVALAAALVIAATQSLPHGVALALSVLACALYGPRMKVTEESQHVAAGVALVPAALFALPFTQDSRLASAQLSGVWCAVATWAVLASATRLVMTDPAWRARGLLAFGSIAVLCAGYARVTVAFVVLSWSFVVASLGASRACDPDRPSLRRLSGREWVVASIVALSTLGLSALSARGLPAIHEYLVARYAQAEDDASTTGFTPWLDLGSMRDARLSETLVMRVHGPAAPPYLRGTAYDRYENGRWRNTRTPATTIVRTGEGPLRGAGAVRVERVAGIVGWYFLPLDARDVSTLNGSVRRDRLGTVRGVPGDDATEVWFRFGARDSLQPSEPAEVDREVPASVRRVLAPMVARWTSSTVTDAARMESLRLHLRREYRYSLHFERTPLVDPVVDFLTKRREGHCEYFASALALLGRTAGVSTRVVGGYRVAERNPFGGYHVVREKNAHAWVEAWVDGAWVTFDATPPSAIPYNQQHNGSWWRSAADVLSVRARMALAWAVGAGSNALLGLAAVLLVAWLSWRAWRARNTVDETAVAAATLRPLPCLEALSEALAAAGVARGGAETLERFATRVEGSELPAGPRVDAAQALRRYAALRYGERGDEAEVAGEVMRAAERVRGGQLRQARPSEPVR